MGHYSASILITVSVITSATAMSQTQLCVYAQGVVDKISPGGDAAIIDSHIPRLLAISTPKPMYYYNYNVGECRDLVFGVSLVDYANSRDLEDGQIPKIINICINEIEERGLNSEGIYRVTCSDLCVVECALIVYFIGVWSACCSARSEFGYG